MYWTKRSSNACFLALIVLIIILFIIYSTKSTEHEYYVIITNSEDVTNSPVPFNKSLLFNLYFNYTLNSSQCDKNVYAVVIVTSYFGDVETRSSMRRAFPNENLKQFNIRRVFLLGQAPKDKYTKQEAIADENKRFRDIVQGNFQESYRNLTYKHIMGHRWVNDHCKNAKYVIKMDDDIVINFYKTLDILKNLAVGTENFMAGYILNNMKPIREPKNKWYVNEKEYQKSIYPSFLSGWFYITTPKVSESIVMHSHTVPYFWIDDVYVTGEIALKMNARHYNLSNYFTVNPEILHCCMRDVQQHNLDCDVVFGPNGGDNNLFFSFNRIMKTCAFSSCKKPINDIRKTCVTEMKFDLNNKGNAFISNYKL